ncbi:MAG: MFS transporter [Acutalibacteraceae bacterium]|nr:MFS transporter [Acutalibacteraceae bacterium]
MKIASKVKDLFVTKEGWSTEPTERASYYSYFAGQNMIYTLFNVCLTTYLLFLGIDPIKSAAVMLIVKVWDAVNDTLFGVIFDTIKFRSGKKYLPWIKISTILIPLATILTFVIPSASSETVKLIWFAVAYILWDTAYTLCDVPIFGVLTSMSQSVDERNTIQSLKSIATYAGVGITSTLSTVLISEKVGMNYGMIAIVICVIAFALMLPASYKLKERYHAEAEETFTIRRMFSYLFKNKYLLIYYVGIFFYSSLSIGNAFTLYVSYYLFNSALFSIVVGAVGTVPQLLIALLLPKIIRRFDKMKVNQVCLLLYVILSVITWLVGYGNIVVYIILFTVRSIPLAVVALEMFMFTPDCAEYGRFKTGTEAKGITFAMQTFMAKLTGSISGSLGLFILGLKSVGWKVVEVGSFQELEQSGVTQTPHALNMLWLIFMLIPAIGGLLAYIVWSFYDLKDKDVQVMIDCNTGKITREEAMSMLSKKYDIEK